MVLPTYSVYITYRVGYHFYANTPAVSLSMFQEVFAQVCHYKASVDYS